MKIKTIDNKGIVHPIILYKYRNWDNELHKKVLTDSILYMASPRDFEDIHDCNIPQKFPKESELYDFFLKKSKTEYPNRNRREHRQYARYWRDKSPLGNPIQLSQLIECFNNEFNNRFGVLSLTANHDNNAMWEKYADNHKGICLGFDAKSLFECVGGGGEVQYVDKLPTINFADDDFLNKHIKNIFFKENKWSFEQEYRLHKMWESNASNDKRSIHFPIESLVEIRLGKNMSQDVKEDIKRIAKQKYPNAKIIECH